VTVVALQNSFESGADGVTVTAVNSGGVRRQNAFQSVAGTSWAYESSDGVFSAQAVNPLDASYMQWSGLGALKIPVYLRYFVNFTAVPTVAHWIAGCYVNAAVNAVWAPFAFGTDGLLYDHNFAGAAQSPSGSNVAYGIGSWIRVESRALASTTVGESEYRLYNDPAAHVDAWTARKVRAGVTMAIGDIDIIRNLGGAGAANSTVTVRVTRPAWSFDTWVGPGDFPRGLRPDYSAFPDPLLDRAAA
jgi:hypothetical protein